ncbi:hypothetical protein [Paracidovorax avenae]|uniref:hypothetical protein n=1 Tax=Paracidovorax avenae TaxID=80867 RepID=UPI00131492A4|nr:hypothetical protein [Paracidovorax avenae]
MIVFFMEHEGSARKSLPPGRGRPGGATGEREFLEAGFSHQSENLGKNQASFSQLVVLGASIQWAMRNRRCLHAGGRGRKRKNRPKAVFRFLADSAPVANGGQQGHPGCFA